MKFESIFFRSPLIIQKLLLNCQGLIIKYRRYSPQFKKELNRYLNNYNEGKVLVDNIQLRKFLVAASDFPYWSQCFEDHHINLESADIVSEIRKLPILTKAEVKQNIKAFESGTKLKHTIQIQTSGTTGSGMIFPQTIEAENKQWAVWWRYRIANGIKLDDWMGWFGGRKICSITQKRPPFWRVVYPLRQVMFSSHHLSNLTIQKYYEVLRSRKIKWIHGYPSQIALLANLIKEAKLDKLTDLKIITLGSETLLAHQRNIISEVFAVPYFQHYGLAEGVANISEYPQEGMVVDSDFAFVEFVPVDTGNNTICRIIGTNYSNPAFPLIRYDTGDIATGEWISENSFKVHSIDGRVEDVIVLKNGITLGRLDHIFKGLIHIKEAQIIQKESDRLVFRIVKGGDYDSSKEEQKLIMEINKYLGNEISVKIEYADTIQKTKNGKLRLVISEVKKHETDNTRPEER